MPSTKITKTAVDSAKPEATDWFLWDTELKGFGLKVSKGGRKSYVCQYRTPGGRSGENRRITIGGHGSPWTVETARAEAKKILGRVPMAKTSAREAGPEEIGGEPRQTKHGCATKRQHLQPNGR